MQKAIEIIISTYKDVFPRPFYLLYTVAAIVFLLVRRKSNHEKLMGLYSATILLFLFLPPIAYLAAPFLRDGDVYWRYLWVLPIVVILPYAAVLLISRSPRRIINAAVCVLLAAALMFGGRNLYAAGVFHKATSREKVLDHTLVTARVIEENIEKTGHRYAYLAAPFQVSHEIREVSSAPRIYSKRYFDFTYLKENYPIRYYNVRVLNGLQTDEQHKTVRNLKKRRCNYIYMPTGAGCDEDLVKYGYEVIFDGGAWKIWYNPKVLGKKEAKEKKRKKAEQKKALEAEQSKALQAEKS